MIERDRATDTEASARSGRADAGGPASADLEERAGGRIGEIPRGELDGVSVLLVEDDPISREELGCILAHYGARIVSAESTRVALSCYEATTPSIVVSDIGLPDEDGCALMCAIRAREAGSERTPAIAVSGFPSCETGDRVRRAGFDAFLPKPIDIGALFRMMRILIAGPGSR